MQRPEPSCLIAAIESGQSVSHDTLAGLASDERAALVDALLPTPTGRRWLRGDPALDDALAGRLLAFEDDFRASRRDRSLTSVVQRAPVELVVQHAPAIASGAAASALWERLDDASRIDVASAIVAGPDRQAAEATLYLLVLDSLNPYRVDDAGRTAIAAGALSSDHSGVRGLAAEFLAERRPAALAQSFDGLITDESERVRGVAWAAALRHDRPAATERAFALLGDESAPLAARRSALVAVGTALPTAEMIELLSYFVVHPDEELATDAAGLLDRQHRNPITAEAARNSPHEAVRELAERLLDPLRGSPAAGGSRPGDPTRSSADIYAGMIQQLEERSRNRQAHDER